MAAAPPFEPTVRPLGASLAAHPRLLAVVGSLALGGTAHAAEVRTVSRTMGEGYMVRLPGPEGQLLARRRLVQYVNVGVHSLLPPKEPDQIFRDPRDGQLRIVTSMRLRHDFGSFLRRAESDAARRLESLDGRQIDLLYGYLEGERLGGWVDFRLGRQFEMSGLDFYAFDGGWLRADTPAHIAVEAFGGLQVDGTALFGFPTFELDGTEGTPADESRSPMVGAAFALSDVRWMDARFAYRRTWSPASINEEIVGLLPPAAPGTVVDQELVSATLALRLWDGRIAPHAAARYNLGTGRFDDTSAGLTWALTEMHTVRAQYLRTIPSFDLDSIFNVFASEPFEDLRVVYEVRPGQRWRLYGRFQGRFFLADETAALGTRPAERLAFGGGGGAGATYQRRRFALRLDGYGLGGEGGLRVGGSVDTRTHVLYDRVALDGRAYFVYYEDDLVKERQGYSLALQAGTNVRLAPGIHLAVVGEELFTTFYKQAFRALGVLSFDWTFRAGAR